MVEVKGNGKIITKEMQVSTFLRLHISAKGTTELIQSAEEKVVIEADENLMEYFDIQNAGRTLYVSSEAKLRKPCFTKCSIKIYFRQIEVLNVICDGGDVISHVPITLTSPIEIKVQSTGNTELNLDVPAIKLISQTVGNVTLKGKCNTIEIKNQSQGNFSSKGLLAQDLKIKNMAEGDVDLFSEKTISISHYGEGKISYSGNAVVKDIKQYGSGPVKHC